MKVDELRQKYPVFSFDKYEYLWAINTLNIKYYYSINGLNFVHNLQINNLPNSDKNINDFVYDLGLAILPSYWKLTCSKTISLPHYLTHDQLSFWHKLLIKGMGEYYYINQIDFTKDNFLKIECRNLKASTAGGTVPPERDGRRGAQSQIPNSNRVLVPVGGGKDSIVTLELLKPHFQVTAFTINPVSIIKDVIIKADVTSIFTQNTFDLKLIELNKQGFLNGHTPVSAIYAFCSLLVAFILDIPYVAFSNERSSSEGNTEYLGHEINHQYSKTLEFETNLNNYISSPKYFSFLRPSYELQITKLFSQFPQYFDIFSSCNNNFKMNPATNKVWCGQCPKCVSTALMLACFIGKEKVTQIMGVFPPDLPSNQVTLNQLTGQSPVKPFECVLTRKEAIACTTGQGLDEILQSWQENRNMPEEFSKILKDALHS